MSDERFDQDLRAVLLEDAPRGVPDDLRRRVAAVSTSQAIATPIGPAWQRPPVRWAGLLAAAVVVLAVGAWQLRPTTDPGVGIGSSPSPSTVPSSSPTASSSPSTAPDLVACLAADLDAGIVGWQGAAGSRIADIRVTNDGSRPCVIRGTPGLELIDATGRVLIDSTRAGPSGEPHVAPTDERFELAPGDHLDTEVQVSNFCESSPVLPVDIAFDLPNAGGRLVAGPEPGVSSAEAVPPCMGSGPSSISTNGWRR